VKIAARISVSLVLGCSITAWGQGLDLRGYELDWTTSQLIPILRGELHGSVKCETTDSAGARIQMSFARGYSQSFGSPKIVTARSDAHGRFNVGSVIPDGYWKLTAVAFCDGSELRTEQTVRIAPNGFDDGCTEREIIVDVKERTTRLKSQERTCY